MKIAHQTDYSMLLNTDTGGAVSMASRTTDGAELQQGCGKFEVDTSGEKRSVFLHKRLPKV